MSLREVSVVTPSYNQGSFIRDTIESVRRQSYDAVEHIVVDGGSTDETLDVLREYDHLEWVSESDDGQADAINKGVEMASGSIVTWLNSDDIYLHTDTIETVVEGFEDGSDAVYGDIAVMSEDETIWYVFCPPAFDHEKLRAGRISMPPQPSTFFDAELFADSPLDVSLEFVFDYEFWLRKGNEATTAYVDHPIAGFRHHGESKTISTPDGFDRERERVDREYGVVDGPSIPVRFSDVMTSGAVRRVRALKKALRLRRTVPRRRMIDDLTVAPVSRVCWATATQGLR